jgi:hypothetical protein
MKSSYLALALAAAAACTPSFALPPTNTSAAGVLRCHGTYVTFPDRAKAPVSDATLALAQKKATLIGFMTFDGDYRIVKFDSRVIQFSATTHNGRIEGEIRRIDGEMMLARYPERAGRRAHEEFVGVCGQPAPPPPPTAPAAAPSKTPVVHP